MHFMGVNLWAALVSALAVSVAGMLWYSPLLFAKPWMALMGYDDRSKMPESQKGSAPSHVLLLIARIVSAIVLGKIIEVANVTTALHGMNVGFAVWLGFVTTVQLTYALFGRQPTRLYLINTSYLLVSYLVMGAILGAWR
jgi:hypothetical protein